MQSPNLLLLSFLSDPTLEGAGLLPGSGALPSILGSLLSYFMPSFHPSGTTERQGLLWEPTLKQNIVREKIKIAEREMHTPSLFWGRGDSAMC